MSVKCVPPYSLHLVLVNVATSNGKNEANRHRLKDGISWKVGVYFWVEWCLFLG